MTRTRKRGNESFLLPPTKPIGDDMWDAASQLMPRKRKPLLPLHPRALGSPSFSALKLLPQIQMAWRQFLLTVSIPNENSAPSITSTAITSNSPLSSSLLFLLLHLSLLLFKNLFLLCLPLACQLLKGRTTSYLPLSTAVGPPT